MKVLFLLTLFNLSACYAQEIANRSVDLPDKDAPETPSMDSLNIWCSLNADLLTRVQKKDRDGCDLYYFEDELFTGWACRTLADTEHKYRYEQFMGGKMTWRIGYYSNGQRDADFRIKDCKSYGLSRMWMRDGNMYIDEYYASPGVADGLFRRWHDNNVIAREVMYENGRIVFERLYNRDGDLLN